jgi:hypothetical protein
VALTARQVCVGSTTRTTRLGGNVTLGPLDETAWVLLAANAAAAAAAAAKLRQMLPSLTLALQALGLAGADSEGQGPGPRVMRIGWDAVDPLRTDGTLNRACREGAHV